MEGLIVSEAVKWRGEMGGRYETKDNKTGACTITYPSAADQSGTYQLLPLTNPAYDDKEKVRDGYDSSSRRLDIALELH